MLLFLSPSSVAGKTFSFMALHEISGISTHKFEDGVLYYSVIFNAPERENEWHTADEINEEIIRNYWLNVPDKLPFRKDINETLEIDSIEQVNTNKKQSAEKPIIFTIHFQGNSIDEYHLLNNKQLISLNVGPELIIRHYLELQ